MAEPIFEVVTLRDGAKTRVARYLPDVKLKGVIQMVHGFGEHIGSYSALCAVFAEGGYAAVIHDQRGFGDTPGVTEKRRLSMRGVIPSCNAFFDDIDDVYRKIGEWFPNTPTILFGHSMGGNIVINYLIKNNKAPYIKAIIESPWLRLCKPMPGWLTIVARVMGSISGNIALKSGLNMDVITRDILETDKLKTDKIFHDRISFRLYAAIVDMGEYAIKHAAEIKIPALLLCAGDDMIVSAGAIREFSKNAGENVTFIEFEGGYHALHADIIQDEVIEKMLNFNLTCRAD